MKCPKCGSEMSGYTDYDGLNDYLDKKKSLKDARVGYMCKNPKCGHEEKVGP